MGVTEVTDGEEAADPNLARRLDRLSGFAGIGAANFRVLGPVKVLQLSTSPDFKTVVSHWTRCADEQ
jgi:hypothetical protein